MNSLPAASVNSDCGVPLPEDPVVVSTQCPPGPELEVAAVETVTEMGQPHTGAAFGPDTPEKPYSYHDDVHMVDVAGEASDQASHESIAGVSQ